MGKVVALITPLSRNAIVTELAEIRMMQDEYRVAYDELLSAMEEEGLLHVDQFITEQDSLEYHRLESAIQAVKDRIAGIQLRMSELRAATAKRYDAYRRHWGLS